MITSEAATVMPSPDRQWTAVLARDARADGTFVYGVSSTGIYCRPTCPSRRPRRDRVRFFADPAAAARAGFRACKRCRPDSAGPSAQAQAIARVSAFLRAHADEPVTLARLGRLVGLSATHLQRAFTRQVGVSPRQFQAACRADRFRRALGDGRAVTDAVYEAGYGSPSRVYEVQPTGAGVSPARYRTGAAGVRISVSLAACSLGRVLVAATAEGVCAVKIGDSDRALMAALAREFPAADITTDTPPRAAWVRAVVARIDGRPTSADVPLDVRGTAFQWRVWEALRRIPAGETRTYAEVATAIGRPTAARAVARACATNPVAVVIPCHRVLPKGGGTGGYRWGPERKQRLLKRERARRS
ncbi:MAG: bifunctional DNA-binding transcriptional regulator/O6-methylguanine-DNA methyltransferase Ada [Vicinamibacterales bacterium]|nr:bifunctional DNA-binding transcriptional regulator/O6-methylguanine-DNA methyltransferase Ada [Vicinamibacterales bacterium]